MFQYTHENIFTDNESIFVERHFKNDTVPDHTHNFIEIVYIVSGSGIQCIDDKKYPVKSGCMIFINYGQVHSFEADNMTLYNILLKPEAISDKIINTDNAFEILTLTAFEEFRSLDPSSPFMYFEGTERERIELILGELDKEFKNRAPGSETVMKSCVAILLTHIFRNMLGCSRDFTSVPNKITQYISEHFHEKLSVELLAKKCFYTPKYFGKIFKECYGISVLEYIQQKRVEEGCRLLRETNLSIDEISHKIGYADNVRFYKYFKKIYGMTPLEYRKKRVR